MAPWVRTVTGGGREEQMQEQDEVLLASATMWDWDCLSAVAWLRMEASSLAGISCHDASTGPCPIFWRHPCVMPRHMGRCS